MPIGRSTAHHICSKPHFRACSPWVTFGAATSNAWHRQSVKGRSRFRLSIARWPSSSQTTEMSNDRPPSRPLSTRRRDSARSARGLAHDGSNLTCQERESRDAVTVRNIDHAQIGLARSKDAWHDSLR